MLEIMNIAYIMQTVNHVEELINTPHIIETLNHVKEIINIPHIQAIGDIEDIYAAILILATICSSNIIFEWQRPGGKSILNDQGQVQTPIPYLYFDGPGGKNILNDQGPVQTPTHNVTHKLEQEQIQEQEQKEIEITLRVTRTRRLESLRPGQEVGAILYEPTNKESTSIVNLARIRQYDIAHGSFGDPCVRRTGVHLDTILPDNTYRPAPRQS